MTEVEVLREALRMQRSWVRHWKADKDCGLTPTDDSLLNLPGKIDAALGFDVTKREAPALLAGE